MILSYTLLSNNLYILELLSARRSMSVAPASTSWSIIRDDFLEGMRDDTATAKVRVREVSGVRVREVRVREVRVREVKEK